MDQIFGWLVKLLFIVMLAPFFVCLILQVVIGAAVAILPWVILSAAVAGLVAGISAALVLRRRLPPTPQLLGSPRASLSGQHRVRRPKGGRGTED